MQHVTASRTAFLAAIVVAALLGSGASALAQPPSGTAQQPDESRPWSFHGSMGFTLDPSTFLLGLGAEYAVTESIGVGPLLQLGLSDDDKIVAPTANVTWGFDLSEIENETLRELRPFLQGGMGFAYVDKDRAPGKDDDDAGFLMNFGFGVEYPVTEHFSVGNNVMFNIMPWNVVGENFFFSWQFAAARFRF